MSEGVGLREFGRLVGVSGEAIRKAIKSERIPPRMVGGKALSSGRIVPIITDVDGARKAFGGNTDPIQKRPGALISASKRSANAQARGDDAAVEHHRRELNQASGPDAPDLEDEGIPTLPESRRVLNHFKAQRERLEYMEKMKTLVPIEEVGQAVGREYANVRAALLAIPAKIADELAQCDSAADARLIVEAAITDALSELTADAQ